MDWFIPRQYQFTTINEEQTILQWEEDKHIKAKFFFIKDKVDNGEMQIIDCPTEQMWADVLTKPLQGIAFKQM